MIPTKAYRTFGDSSDIQSYVDKYGIMQYNQMMRHEKQINEDKAHNKPPLSINKKIEQGFKPKIRK